MNDSMQGMTEDYAQSAENEAITAFSVKRRSMEELSEYFEKDSRRYDRGFEFY